MSDEKRLKSTDTVAKVLILIPTFLFVVTEVLFNIAKFTKDPLSDILCKITAYGTIIHVFPGCIFSIVGLIITIGRDMKKYRVLGVIQIILDLIAFSIFLYAYYHA